MVNVLFPMIYGLWMVFRSKSVADGENSERLDLTMSG